MANSPNLRGREVTSDYEPSVDGGSIFGSVTSSVQDHVWEFGRRYHMYKYGRYPMPNDDEEFNRETLRHLMFKELLEGKLFLAPIGDSPQKIIDLGTGFGEWAIEIGEQFPSATVIGVDLSPIQPVWIPPNVEFIVDDIEDEWVYANDFDYVHLRFVSICIKDNSRLQQRILQNLKPGGWVEFQDFSPQIGSDDGSVPPGYAVQRLFTLCADVFKTVYDFEPDYVTRLPADLQRLGYQRVESRVFNMPIGDWHTDPRQRTIGGYLREVLMNFTIAVAARPLVEYGMEKSEINELVNAVRHALSDRSIHAWVPMHYVWAQKPPT
ncbi:S-adenosyl-L-methionine-dependent methyltransferase [Podospora conica]|nr:S-adenosyl-L-methionine-dependent methyltransferase [Schizothecium conicum]